jgi:hypothetical protein
MTVGGTLPNASVAVLVGKLGIQSCASLKRNPGVARNHTIAPVAASAA